MSATVFTDNFVPEVFQPGAYFLLTVRAAHVGCSNFHGSIVGEGMLAMLALNFEPLVLAVNAQFLEAAGAADIVATGSRRGGHADLRQREEAGDFDAVFRQFGIQQCAARATVDQSGRHIFAALRAGPARPFSGHGIDPWTVDRFGFRFSVFGFRRSVFGVRCSGWRAADGSPRV